VASEEGHPDGVKVVGLPTHPSLLVHSCSSRGVPASTRGWRILSRHAASQSRPQWTRHGSVLPLSLSVRWLSPSISFVLTVD